MAAGDVRDEIFRTIATETVTATVSTERDGVLFGIEEARRHAAELGLELTVRRRDGARVRWGDMVLVVRGSPKAVVSGEDVLLGAIGKASGIATAAAEAVRRAMGRVRVVSGAWKKMPPESKAMIRGAVRAGGADFRITDRPFLYLDKNYLRLLGGIRRALDATAQLSELRRVVQIRGEERPIAEEALEAAAGGAGIVMIDSGDMDDIDRVARALADRGLRESVEIAFAGGIALDGIEDLAERDVDILDIGSAIVDAPLLPLRFDVVPRARGGALELDLLEKTELWIRPIDLVDANLQAIGRTVAAVLDLPADEVLVTDVRDRTLTLDVLRRTVLAEQIAGKERPLLERLAAIPGVRLTDDTGVHSEGVLGWIALDEPEVASVIESGRELGERIRAAIARRAIVFATGTEIREGNVRDTNTGLVTERLRRHGFRVAAGGILPDDAETIGGAVRRAAAEGYGLVVTTGGLGAEDKDHTVEGIQRVDAAAATPYLVRFTRGTGRHVKDGVRLAVGEIEGTLVVGLPGPNEEVSAALDVLVEGLRDALSKEALAEAIASRLREIVREKMARHGHQH